MKSVLEGNVAALAGVQRDLAHRIAREQPSDALTPVTTRDGQPGFAASGRALHSRYDPRREATRLIDSSVPEGTATVVILGVGGGFTTRAVIDSRPGTTVVALERSPGTLAAILARIDLSPQIRSGRIRFCVDPELLTPILQDVHLPLMRSGIRTINLPQWTELPENRDFFRTCRGMIQEVTRYLIEQAITIRRFARPWLVHSVHNSHSMGSEGEFFSRLHGIGKALSDKTVFVAAAGPGLDSFLDQPAERARLRTAPLFAVDTALPALLSRGITTEAVVSLDPQPWSVMHMRGRISAETVLFADLGVAPSLARRSEEAGTVWFAGTHPLHQLLYAHGAPCLLLPESPDSVTEAAVLLARGLGAARVELIGADGGYPGARTYAGGTAHYSLAARAASRLSPQAHFFARQVYPSMVQEERKGGSPFFTSPAMGERAGRIRQALSSSPRIHWPRHSSGERFDPVQFWRRHLMELDNVASRLRSSPAEALPDTTALRNVLGPHGVAHVPLLARMQREQSRRFIPGLEAVLREIQGFIFTENSRYS
ncbi:MAG: DUF115 domain-containing protein [Spirochaetaceae bacterium]|nr:MAG: DUF115 domain-containing protein [Spirochaetaceae bacterium]